MPVRDNMLKKDKRKEECAAVEWFREREKKKHGSEQKYDWVWA